MTLRPVHGGGNHPHPWSQLAEEPKGIGIHRVSGRAGPSGPKTGNESRASGGLGLRGAQKGQGKNTEAGAGAQWAGWAPGPGLARVRAILSRGALAPGARGGWFRGLRPPPRGGAGVLPGTPPARALCAPLTGECRRPAAASIRTGPNRAAARRPTVRGAGSPRRLPGPAAGDYL